MLVHFPVVVCIEQYGTIFNYVLYLFMKASRKFLVFISDIITIYLGEMSELDYK